MPFSELGVYAGRTDLAEVSVRLAVAVEPRVGSDQLRHLGGQFERAKRRLARRWGRDPTLNDNAARCWVGASRGSYSQLGCDHPVAGGGVGGVGRRIMRILSRRGG